MQQGYLLWSGRSALLQCLQTRQVPSETFVVSSWRSLIFESLDILGELTCFTENSIDGRKLIHVTCSTLPHIGVTGFEDMKVIAQLVRDLLGVTEPSWNRSISLPRRDNMGLFLEQKSQTGHNHDLLIYNQFIKEQGL